MFTFNRGAAAMLSGVMAFGCIAPVFAATPNMWDEGHYTHNQQEGSDSNVDVNVLVQNRTVPVIFSAYVPATVKIAVSRDKQIITPENLRIINGVDTLPIGVWDVYAKPVNGWTILDWDTNFKDKQLTDQKKFAMTMNGNDLSAPVSKLPWEIQPAGELPLELDAKITYQSQAKDLEEIMTVSFTMDWMDRVGFDYSPAHATGSPFDRGTADSYLQGLTGRLEFSRAPIPADNEIVKGQKVYLNGDHTVCAVIDGQDAIVYSKDGGGVFAPDSRELLDDYRAKEMILYGLDLTKTTQMHDFFCYETFTSLRLNGMNTSTITDTSYAFHGVQAPYIDLSGLDMSKVTSTNYMFGGTKTNRVYCRTHADREKMINSGSNSLPASVFVVGQPPFSA